MHNDFIKKKEKKEKKDIAMMLLRYIAMILPGYHYDMTDIAMIFIAVIYCYDINIMSLILP